MQLKKTLTNHILYKISCWTLGALFIFSGLAKGINPFGLSLQFTDYFAVLHLDFLTPFVGVFGVALPVVEATLGVMLICGWYRRLTAWGGMMFMGFFTLLTLWIAIENPVTDCGCFGDLLVISNWATFYKNVVFMIPTVVVFMGRNRSPQNWKIRSVLFTAIGFSIFPVIFYFSLPPIDATPFKMGVNIWEAMHDGVPAEVETRVVYRNKTTTQVQEFSLGDTTWQDTDKWEYVDTRSVITREGKENSITQLPMIDQSGVDRAGDVLQTTGVVLLIVSPDPTGQTTDIVELLEGGHGDGEPVQQTVLLHPTLQEVEIPNVSVYSSDYKTLHTVIQNHRGGYLVLKDGVIIKKGVL